MLKEPQYDPILSSPEQKLGIMSGHTWHTDPKRLGIVLARYKTVAYMLAGLERVLELGCGDAFASRVVKQHVKLLTVTDFDQEMIIRARKNKCEEWPMIYKCHDMTQDQWRPGFSWDAIYGVDFIEHIKPEDERKLLKNIVDSLGNYGICIMGTPSLESQVHASQQSKAGHVNCKTVETLRSTMLQGFHNVLILTMNDEAVLTGFPGMAHYLLAYCTGPKK